MAHRTGAQVCKDTVRIGQSSIHDLGLFAKVCPFCFYSFFWFPSGGCARSEDDAGTYQACQMAIDVFSLINLSFLLAYIDGCSGR